MIKMHRTTCWAKLLGNSQYSRHTMFKPRQASRCTATELHSDLGAVFPVEWSCPSPLSGKCLYPMFSKLSVYQPYERLIKTQSAGLCPQSLWFIKSGRNQELAFLISSWVQEPLLKNHRPYIYLYFKNPAEITLPEWGQDGEGWGFTFLFSSQETVDRSVSQQYYSSGPESTHRVCLYPTPPQPCSKE